MKNETDIELYQGRLKLREKLADLATIIENSEPTSWWFSMMLWTRRTQKKLTDLPEPIAHHIEPLLVKVDARLMEYRSGKKIAGAEGIALTTDKEIMRMSNEMATPFSPEIESKNKHNISLEELVKTNPESLRLTKSSLRDYYKKHQNNCGIIEKIFSEYPGSREEYEELTKESVVSVLEVRNPITKKWYKIPVPDNFPIWHKGGTARLVLKIMAKSSKSLIASELPPKDIDVIVAGDDMNTVLTALVIGADSDGIEHLSKKTMDFDEYSAGRDTDFNQVTLGPDGLTYTDEALEAAKSGIGKLTGLYTQGKALYNTDRATIEGLEMAKPRGLGQRLLKFVSEGKLTAFELMPVNANMNIDIYSLFLAKKWAKRENAPELMQRLFYLVIKIGYEIEEEKVTDWIERCHTRMPFFDFDKEIKDVVGVTKWKVKKAIKQVDRETAWRCKIPTDLVLIRKEGDTEKKLISLEGFVYNPAEGEQYKEWWDGYLERSRKRTDNFKAKKIPPMRTIFYLDADEADLTPPE